MSANVSVVSLNVLGKEGTVTVEKIDAWLQHALQIVINHPDLEVKVLTQGLYPGVGEALVGLIAQFFFSWRLRSTRCSQSRGTAHPGVLAACYACLPLCDLKVLRRDPAYLSCNWCSVLKW